jgi:hemerythrin
MSLIEGHYTVDGFYEAIDDAIDEAWENFLSQASCHFHTELEALMDDLGLEPIEDDVLPF